MNDQLKKLVDQYKNERTARDGGAAAKLTYIRIKMTASSEELVEILEEVFHLL
jgi:hypothetical protein